VEEDEKHEKMGQGEEGGLKFRGGKMLMMTSWALGLGSLNCFQTLF
jgi:hypothetical protein